MLDAPYAPTLNFNNPEQRTHQQLFDDVLQRNGIALGWAVDYGLQDWSVPAGVFAHQGSYISALVTLAKAGGAYLIPHPRNASFKVRPLYPAAPWDWGDVTPDFVLPSASVSRESIAWSDKPNYNRVFVSGQELGVLGQVKRQGTAGDWLAPMVTDSLIATAAAARQRGLAVLSDTGRQLDIGLRLPVLPATGVIQPGAYILPPLAWCDPPKSRWPCQRYAKASGWNAMRNQFQQFLDLVPDPALQVGTVQSVAANLATVILPGGGLLKARGGSADLVGQAVFVRNDVVEGKVSLFGIKEPAIFGI